MQIKTKQDNIQNIQRTNTFYKQHFQAMRLAVLKFQTDENLLH